MPSDYARRLKMEKAVSEQTLHAYNVIRESLNAAVIAGDFDCDLKGWDARELRALVMSSVFGWLIQQTAITMMDEPTANEEDCADALHDGAGFVASVMANAITRLPTAELQTYTVGLLRKALDGEDMQ